MRSIDSQSVGQPVAGTQKHRSGVSGPGHSLPPLAEWVVSEQIDGWHQPGNTPSYSYYLWLCQKSHTDRLHTLTEWCITDRLHPHTHNNTLRTESLDFPGRASHEGGRSDEKWCSEREIFSGFVVLFCFFFLRLLFRISVSNFCSWLARLWRINLWDRIELSIGTESVSSKDSFISFLSDRVQSFKILKKIWLDWWWSFSQTAKKNQSGWTMTRLLLEEVSILHNKVFLLFLISFLMLHSQIDRFYQSLYCKSYTVVYSSCSSYWLPW